MFFDDYIITVIVNETNNNIRRFRGSKTYEFLNDDKNCHLHETDEIEIRALFGLMYLRGALGQTKHDVRHLFGLDGHHGCVLSTPFLF